MEARSTLPVAAAISPSFGAMLKRYRRAAGLTQESLAERAGYSVGHISKLESSVRRPVSATVDLLADALKLSPAEHGALVRAARPTEAHYGAATWANVPPQLPLFGRSEEEKRIGRHIDADDEPPLLLLAGEPGIGKTRLLQAATERGTSAGWFVLGGTCRRHGVQGPYGPLLDALVSTMRHMEPAHLREALDGCSWLVRMVPEIAEIARVQMPAWALPADQERRLMFSAVERFLRNVAGPSGTLLVLDNLQWAGADALALLSSLVEGAPMSFLRILGAYRQNEVHAEDPLHAQLADLAHDGLATREVVGPLAPGDAAELLDELLAGSGSVDAQTRDAVLFKAAGVPFVLVSYAHWLRSPAYLGQGEPTTLGVPWDVTQIVLRRVAVLPAAAQAVVHIAAVSEGDDARALLTRVGCQLGFSEMEIIEAIDAACEAGILVQQSDGRYAFTYDLFREVVEGNLGSAQRAHLHGKIAEALADEHVFGQVETIAAHYVQADDSENAHVYLKRAGAKAKAVHAYAFAEQYYRALAERLESSRQTKEAMRAREHLGTVLSSLGRHDEALTELDRAREGYRAQGLRDSQARVTAAMGSVYYARGDIEQGIACLEHEVSTGQGVSNRSRATLYMTLAQLYNAAALYGRELESAEHAVESARAGDNRHLLALAEVERGTALGLMDRLDEGLQVLEGVAVPLSEATGDLWTQAQALDQAANSRILRGEFAEAEVDIARGLLVGWQLDDPFVSGLMTLNRGILRFYTGAWRQAQADCRWASVMLQSSQMPLSHAARALVWLGRIALSKGRWEQAANDLQRGLAIAARTREQQSRVVAHCTLAEWELMEEKPDAARLRLERLLAGGERRNSDLTEALALLGWAHLELGDDQQSEVLVAASVIRASATGLRCALADALRVQALLSAREGRWQEALATIDKALSLAHELSYSYAEAKTLYVSGYFLIERGEVTRGSEQMGAARVMLSQLDEHFYANHDNWPARAMVQLDLDDR